MSVNNNNNNEERNSFITSLPKYDVKATETILQKYNKSLNNNNLTNQANTPTRKLNRPNNHSPLPDIQRSISKRLLKKKVSSINGLINDINDKEITNDEKYYGYTAIQHFHERYHYISNQNQVNNYSLDQSLDSIHFDNHNKKLFDLQLINSKRPTTSYVPKQIINEKRPMSSNATVRSSTKQINEVTLLDQTFPYFTNSRPTSRQSNRLDKEKDNNSIIPIPSPLTPRSKYIASCIQNQVNPRASLVIRKDKSIKLNLSHLTIGDNLATHLSNSLHGLPDIESIDISDNKLTDKSMVLIIQSISNLVSLKELDLSNNVIGPKAAAELSAYLKRPNCTLNRLYLRQADVDDIECSIFVKTLHTNRSLIEIDLSDNKIGELEAVSYTSKEVLSGAKALANYLTSKECKLKILKLNWNYIRNTGAIVLCQSISLNQTLLYLDLSYNHMDLNTCIELSNSIQKNNTIETLILDSNEIDSLSCFILSAGVLENKSLKIVNLNNNPIGVLGSKALMLIPLIIGNRVKLSIQRCNTTISNVDISDQFDFNHITRSFSCNLFNPVERSIVIMLFNLVAGHQTYDIMSCTYETTSKNKKSIEFVHTLTNRDKTYFTDKQNKTIESLIKIQSAIKDKDLAMKLFHEIDADGSGELDRDELKNLLHMLGVELTQRRLDEIMETYDTNGEGKIDIHGYLLLLDSYAIESYEKLQELLNTSILIVKDPDSRIENEVFSIPWTGKLNFTIENSFNMKLTQRTLNYYDKDHVSSVVKGVSNYELLNMLSYGITTTKMRLDEGLSLFNQMKEEINDKTVILSYLLPHAYNAETARQMIKYVLDFNRSNIVKLKRSMNYTIKPLIGSCNGYYILDLSKMNERNCLIHLLAISKTREVNLPTIDKLTTSIKKQNKSLDKIYTSDKSSNLDKLGNYSQKGNFSCFRNELLNNKPITIDTNFGINLPLNGVIEFDFIIYNDISNNHTVKLNDNKFIYLLKKSNLLNFSKVDSKTIHDKLSYYSNECDYLLANIGKQMIQNTTERNKRIVDYQTKFYKNLNIRSESSKYSNKSSNDKSLKDLMSPKVVIDYKQRFFIKNANTSKSNNNIDNEDSLIEEYEEYEDNDTDDELNNSNDNTDSFDANDLSSPVLSNASNNYQENKRKTSSQMHSRKSFIDNNEVPDEFLQYYIKNIESFEMNKHNKALLYLELCEEIFGYTHIYSRQLAILVELFYNLGKQRRTKYFVLRILSSYEIACIYCRIGILHIFNPLRCDGPYELDLSRYEERMMFKILSILAVVEPGDNFVDKSFRWSYESDYLPGFELVQSWLTDEGLPNRGIVNLTYFSGNGNGDKGCKPDINFRRSLFNLVLIKEIDILPEAQRNDINFNEIDTTKLPGIQCMIRNLDQWKNFLISPVKQKKT